MAFASRAQPAGLGRPAVHPPPLEFYLERRPFITVISLEVVGPVFTVRAYYFVGISRFERSILFIARIEFDSEADLGLPVAL